MKRLSSKATRTAPKRIWLQLGDDPEASRCNFAELADVTWSAGQETCECIEYIRADLVRDAMPINATDDGDPELQRLAKVLGMTANAPAQARAKDAKGGCSESPGA